MAGSVGSVVSDLVMPPAHVRLRAASDPRSLDLFLPFSSEKSKASPATAVPCAVDWPLLDLDGMAPLERSLCREAEPACAGVGLASLRQVARELVAAANECAIEATQH